MWHVHGRVWGITWFRRRRRDGWEERGESEPPGRRLSGLSEVVFREGEVQRMRTVRKGPMRPSGLWLLEKPWTLKVTTLSVVFRPCPTSGKRSKCGSDVGLETSLQRKSLSWRDSWGGRGDVGTWGEVMGGRMNSAGQYYVEQTKINQ